MEDPSLPTHLDVSVSLIYTPKLISILASPAARQRILLRNATIFRFIIVLSASSFFMLFEKLGPVTPQGAEFVTTFGFDGTRIYFRFVCNFALRWLFGDVSALAWYKFKNLIGKD